MTNLTLRIPDDLVRDLEALASAQKKSVEEVALERLSSFSTPPTSPRAVLSAIKKLPHPTPSAVDDLEAAIAGARLPVNDQGAFDRRPGE